MARGARGEEVARSSYEGHAVTVLLATFLFTQRSVDHRCPRELTFFVRLQVLLWTDLLLKSRDSWNESKVVFVFMNSLPEEITSAWLKSIKAATKDRYLTSNDALNCVINKLSASKRQESFKNKEIMASESLLKVTGSGINLIKNISHNAPLWCSISSALLR